MNTNYTSNKNNKMKVMTIVGTRPELIRLSQVIRKLDIYCHHVLVHTGQNYDYELNEIFFQELGIRAPDLFLNCASKTASGTIANVIQRTDDCFELHSPDAVLILGDTNSSLSAISAKRRKIPIFHMEAGNRCFDMRVPEEINRKIVDHLADVNMPYSSIARDYLIREGINPHQIIKTGSPLSEVIDCYRSEITASDILEREGLETNKYFLLSTHREENVDNEKNLSVIISTVNSLVDKYDYPVIFSVHPRTQSRLDRLGHEFRTNVLLRKPFGYFDYMKLQMDALAVISDSGTITEEASIMGFSAINMRETHERPEGMEEGTAIFTGINEKKILNVVEILIAQKFQNNSHLRVVDDYKKRNVSEIVLRSIISYTDYINRVTWRKDV